MYDNNNNRTVCVINTTRQEYHHLLSRLLQTTVIAQYNIGAGRILKVEGHSGGSHYFGAKRRKKFFGAPNFSVVPTQFLMELGAQPSKLNNSNCHF